MSDGILRHTPELTGNSAVRLIVADAALLPFVGEQLKRLLEYNSWLEVGDSVDDTVAEAWSILEKYYDMGLIGMVTQFLSDVPDGWLPFDGATRAEADYPELFAVLPSALKSGSNFTLPDMESSFAMAVTDPDDRATSGGANVTNLTVAQLATHTHTYTPPIFNVDLEAPGVPDVLAAGVGTPTETGSTGSGEDIENRPLYLGFLFAIYAGRT